MTSGLGAALAAILAALAAPPAQAPCGETVISDWYDGRIAAIHRSRCYDDALLLLPEGLVHSDPRSDLLEARARDMRALHHHANRS